MEQEIINLLGKNHTTPIRFELASGFYGLYTYKGSAYVFRDGLDISFDSIDEKDKYDIFGIVLSEQWVLDNTLQ